MPHRGDHSLGRYRSNRSPSERRPSLFRHRRWSPTPTSGEPPDYGEGIVSCLPNGRIEGAKEKGTVIKTEDLHIRHLTRLLRQSTFVQSIHLSDVQGYVESRLREKHRGKPLSPETAKKEVATFRVIWNWAVKHKQITAPAPVSGLMFPKQDEKPPFMTWSEINAILSRNGLSDEQASQYWESLYLSRNELGEVLHHVRTTARHAFIYPFVAFVAHTGARLSEALRHRVEDVDLERRQVLIREKKKSRTRATTYRRIELSPLLVDVLSNWLESHAGGVLT